MATWIELQRELERHVVLGADASSATLLCRAHGLEPGQMKVKIVREREHDWLQLDAFVCKVGEASLEGLLRGVATEVRGALVIVFDECRVRERVLLAPLVATDIHGLFEVIISKAAALRSLGRAHRAVVHGHPLS